MKWWVIAIIVVVVVGITAAIGIPMYQDRERVAKMELAKVEFQDQLQDKWSEVAEMVSLLPMRTSDPKTLRNFATFEYKKLNAMKPFRVDPAYKNQASDFMDKVHDPAMKLLGQLAERIKATDKSLVLEHARDLDESLRKFRENNNDLELRNVNQVAPILEGKFDKLAEAIKPPKPTVIYVNQYPDWVSTPEQRQAYSSMRDVARRYFAARSDLGRRLNWSYGRQNPNEYFSRGDVRSILTDAVSIRSQLETEVSAAERVEGMSELGDTLRTMIRNSYQSLGYLLNGQNYRAFKELSSQNDQISIQVRRKFRI